MDDSPRPFRQALSDSSKDMISDHFVLKERDNGSRMKFEESYDDIPIHLSDAPSEISLIEDPSKNPSSVDVFSIECNECEEKHNLRQVCSNLSKILQIGIFFCAPISMLFHKPCLTADNVICPTNLIEQRMNLSE